MGQTLPTRYPETGKQAAHSPTAHSWTTVAKSRTSFSPGEKAGDWSAASVRDHGRADGLDAEAARQVLGTQDQRILTATIEANAVDQFGDQLGQRLIARPVATVYDGSHGIRMGP